MRTPRLLTGSLALMLVASCESTTATCDCPPVGSTALIYGRVTDVAGAPVQGAIVTAQLGSGGCESRPDTVGLASTGADGRYRAHLMASAQPRPGDCLRAFAAPPAGNTLRGSDTVAFAVGFAMNEVVDSAQVDLVLRAP